MRQNVSSIKDVLSAVILNMSGEKKQKIDQIKEAWKQVAGKAASGHTQPAAYKSKRLIVNVDASAWMYELNLEKEQIRSKLNERLAKEGIVIKEIMLRIGQI